jgi:hypothetical protein
VGRIIGKGLPERSSAGSGTPVALGTPALSGTLLQLSAEHLRWTHGDWTRLFDEFEHLRISRIVIQWVVSDGTSFYASMPGATRPALLEILDAAETVGLQVLVGLVFDASYWDRIAASPDSTAAYLADREARSIRVVDELLPIVEMYRCFTGWYLCEEIDDTNWREPASSAILHSYLHRISDYLKLVSPGVLIAISGFSNSRTAPAELQQLWDGLLLAAPAINVLIFQDGIGAHKLTLADLSLYLAAVLAATKSTRCALWSVIELFEQTAAIPPDTGAFHAVPALFSRVIDQLKIESAFASELIAFTAPDYMLSQSNPAAGILLHAYLQYIDSGGGSRPRPRRSKGP